MEIKHKITIPKPCHEDWNQMTPDETGRFCNSCAKSVIDFTKMKTPEIQQYFIQNQGKKICGRFNNEQLDSVIIQIPRAVLFSQVQFYKIFMLALLISMPGILTCQTKNGNGKKINKVEIVNSKKDSSLIEGRVKIDERFVKDETPMTPERKAKIEDFKKKREALIKKRQAEKAAGTTTGDLTIVTNGVVSVEPYEGKPVVVDKNTLYMPSTVEVEPTYPGGIIKFYEYLNSNLIVSEEDRKITKKIFVSFIIDSDGSLTDIKILRGINEAIDKEVLRVLKSSPEWIPGKLKGENVKVSYSLPIKITAQ